MKWIRVKDRVPDTDRVVLVYSKKDGIKARVWYRGCKIYYTHWMPLPDVPKEKP